MTHRSALPATAEPPGEAAADSRVPPRQRVPAHLVRRLHQICTALMTELYRPHGITPPQFSILAQVEDTPGADRTTLARLCGLDTSSAGQALTALEARDLVRRIRAPDDGRAWSFFATERAETLLAGLRPAARAANDRMLAALPPAEAEAFMRALARLVDHYEPHARPGAGRKPPQRRASSEGASA